MEYLQYKGIPKEKPLGQNLAIWILDSVFHSKIINIWPISTFKDYKHSKNPIGVIHIYVLIYTF